MKKEKELLLETNKLNKRFKIKISVFCLFLKLNFNFYLLYSTQSPSNKP